LKGVAKAPARVKAATSGRRRAPAGKPPAAGERLRTELAKDGDPYGLTVLINQAARVADRLEGLDRLLSADESVWLRLDAVSVVELSPTVAEVRVDVRVDKPLVEERNLSTVLRHLMADIHRQRANIPGGGNDEDDVMEGL
jgi:hypothetical protein